MGSSEDLIRRHLIERSAEVLENTYMTFIDLDKKGMRRQAERLVGIYSRANGLPILPLEAFLRCLESAIRQVWLLADPDDDYRSRIKIAKDPDPLGYWKNQ